MAMVRLLILRVVGHVCGLIRYVLPGRTEESLEYATEDGVALKDYRGHATSAQTLPCA